MSMLRVASVTTLSLVGLALAAPQASAQYRDWNDREWRRGSPYAAPARACDRAVANQVRADKNGAQVQVRSDSMEEHRVPGPDIGVQGEGSYYSGDSWKVFRFSCIYDPQSAQIRSVRYETYDNVYTPGSQTYNRPRDDSRAYRQCERAVRERVRMDKNTQNVMVNAEAADEWQSGRGAISIRGYGSYPSSNETNNFRFYCTYDTSRDVVQAVEYSKVY